MFAHPKDCFGSSEWVVAFLHGNYLRMLTCLQASLSSMSNFGRIYVYIYARAEHIQYVRVCETRALHIRRNENNLSTPRTVHHITSCMLRIHTICKAHTCELKPISCAFLPLSVRL